MTTFAYLTIEIPEGVKVSREEIEKHTGCKVFLFSTHPSSEQCFYLEGDVPDMIMQLEEASYTVSKNS